MFSGNSSFNAGFFKGKKVALINENKSVPFNTLIYLINEYANFGSSQKKSDSVEKIGEDVGARLYEGVLFSGVNLANRKDERKIKIIDMLNYIKYSLWPVLFDKTANGLESFIGDRKHSVSGNELKEYVIYDIDPIYNLRYTNDTNILRYICGILKGFLTYGGFPCSVKSEINEDKDKKQKFEFIIYFDESVYENE